MYERDLPSNEMGEASDQLAVIVVLLLVKSHLQFIVI